MELGATKLRLSGINNLLNAVHPEHGVIWTDSKGIFLAPVHLRQEQVENAGSVRLGEFEFVQSVHWSSSVASETCYMAAVHQQNVTVWRVTGTAPRLNFKQMRKINVQVIPQGCLWNPVCDVLSLLSRQQCSFYFHHTQNRGSFAFPSLEKEKISCGCWSQDGKRLVLGVGAALLIYTWADLDGNISDFVPAAWCIPGALGSITALSPASSNTFVCASDQPLERLCKKKDVDAFLLPASLRGACDSLSIKDSLLHLQQNPKADMQDTAMLHVLKLPPDMRDPLVVAKVAIANMLSPDLLCFQTESQCVVVGSNTQSQFQIFALLDNHLVPAGHMSLSKDDRPKGMCNLPAALASNAVGVLVLVGTAKPADATFPSSSSLAHFTLSLRFFPTRPEKMQQFSSYHSQNLKVQSFAALTKADSVRELKNQSVGESRLQTRTSSYRGDRSTHRMKSPEHVKENSMEPMTVQENSMEPMTVQENFMEPMTVQENFMEPMTIRVSLSPGDSPVGLKKLVEEVNTTNRLQPSLSLETELADFSHSSPKFLNTKLSQTFEINNNVHDRIEAATCKERKTETELFPSHSRMYTGHGETEPFHHDRKAEIASGLHGVFTGVKVPPNDPSDLHTEINGAHHQQIQLHEESKEAPSPLLVLPPSRDGAGGKLTDDKGSTCSSLNSSDSNYEMLERQIQHQKDQIDALQKKLGELSVMVQETSCVFPVHYQNFSEPEFIHIKCVAGGKQANRRFLLDNGRLQLEPVKLAFSLTTVELVLDGEPLVLGANVDGYIPMRFSPGSCLLITGVPTSASSHLN